jgi:hypothetical protein
MSLTVSPRATKLRSGVTQLVGVVQQRKKGTIDV